MNIELAHGTYRNCSLQWDTYLNNQPALIIRHNGEVLLKASVNLPGHRAPEGYISIKNWSENEGILESLIKHNVIEPPEYFISSGFVSVAVCKICPKEPNHENS